MKFLVIGDVHLKVKSPASRIDDYYRALMLKLIQIVKIAESGEYDAVIFTGDFFHTQSSSFNLVYKFRQLLREFKIPIYGVIGNHDVSNGLLSHVVYSPLSVIDELNIIGNEAVEISKGIWLEGCDDLYNLDKDVENYYFKTELPEDVFKIKLVHGTLVPCGAKFFGDYTSVDSLSEMPQDLLISGHIHGNPYAESDDNNKGFIMAGSICRNSKADKRDRIFIIALEIKEDKNWSVAPIELKVDKYEDCFGTDVVSEIDDEFVSKLSNSERFVVEDILTIMQTELGSKDLFIKFKEIWDSASNG